jgi:hypothetical protein
VVDATARVEACLAVDAAFLSARGRGLSAPSQGSALWVAMLGGGAVRSPLWRGLGVVLELGLGAALARPRFIAQSRGATVTVYESPLFTGRFGLGLQWRW